MNTKPQPRQQDKLTQHIGGLLQQGVAHMRAGNAHFAEQCFQEIVRIAPGNVDGWHLQAMLAGEQKQYDKSIELFKKTLGLKPNFAEAHSNMGNVCREAGRFREAVECYRKAVRLQPENAVFHSNLGSGLHHLHDYDGAKKAFRKAIHLDEKNADAWCNLAVIHSVLGEKEEKIAACEKTIAIKPSYGQAYHMLAQDHRWSEKGKHFDTMQGFFDDASVEFEDRLHIGYALAKICEDLGEYDASFDYLTRANFIKRQTFTLDINRSHMQFSQIARQFSKEWIKEHRKHGHKDTRPVFILGMPRSGTTLVEQILDQHSEIHGGGERLFISQIIMGLERDTHKRYPTFMENLPEHVLGEVGQYYMEQLGKLAPKARLITDKLPGNFAHVGFIKTILPDARIIWCRRDARDNAISIFKRQFGGYVPYAYDLYETGRMTDLCDKLRQHWFDVLGDDEIIEVAYEDVVADVEGQAKRILKFLGLEWEDACLDFHRNKRAVTTASYEQVRQPIYTSSIDVWKRYEKHLEPLLTGMQQYKDVPLV